MKGITIMSIRRTSLILFATIFLIFGGVVSAQEGVQNLAVVVNVLANTSLSIVDLDEPNVKKAVDNAVIPLGLTPSDIQILGELGYVVHTGSNNVPGSEYVQIIDLRNRVSLGTIPIGEGTQPQRIAFVNQSKAYVTCDGTNEIRVVDLTTRSVVNIIPGELKPTGITVLNGKAYVTNPAFVVDPISFAVTYMDSSVTVIDTQTDTVLKSIPMPTNATGITNDGESRILVLSAGDFNLIPGNLSIIDTTTDEVEKTVRLRTTPGFSLVLNSKKQVFMNDGFLTNRGLLVYDLASEKWIHDRNDALADFTGGAGLAVDQNDNVYVTIPDWTSGGQDELRVMAPDETLIKTYRVGGPGASIVAIAQLAPSEIAKADVNSDGAVDLFDLVLVANHFGEVGNAIIGDLNSDGIVNILDLVLVSAHFGERVFAAPFGKVVDPKLDNKRIQQAIAALESYPDESPTIRRIADYLRLYLENPAPTVTDTELLANYPNPFNPETWIPFQLSASSPVIVRIYDGQGQLVRNLELGYQRAGVYTSKSQAAFWDGKNEIGERVTSGVYFYQLLADHFTATRKMAILK